MGSQRGGGHLKDPADIIRHFMELVELKLGAKTL